MPDTAFKKLKSAFETLKKNRSNSINRIGSTAKELIRKTVTVPNRIDESEFQQSRRLDFETGKAGGEAAGFKGQDDGEDENRFAYPIRNKKEKRELRIKTPSPLPKPIPIPEDPFAKYERDAFRMKAFSLLKEYAPSEKLLWLKEAPIRRIIDPDSKEISMMQTLRPFPGEQINLKGSFKRYSIRAGHTAPIAGSFQIDTTSHITGFPHPLQHTGWALDASCLTNQNLLAAMQQLAKQLAPGTKTRSNSLAWVEAKREVFNDQCLEEHRKLIATLLETDTLFLPVIEWVSKQNSPFDALASINAFDPYEEPFITEYQTALRQCRHPRLESCAEKQFLAFNESQRRPPPVDKQKILVLLLKLIRSDQEALQF